ncbi:FitA-like ribbon-helix-helix domain-containing protein [Niveispirillum irakense]|uniref:FitA-like ribbon-helix-helix domain-containing protein n=1 Tax=Niveispirillum irakense TaxID=34011 RepID=UPI0004154B2F|nr:hypothetical protein [Niveispirillum irakense]
MAQLLVRGLDDALVAKLKARAARNNRSVEAEHRALLEQALVWDTTLFALKAAALRSRLAGRITDDSADLIREDRDSR